MPPAMPISVSTGHTLSFVYRLPCKFTNWRKKPSQEDASINLVDSIEEITMLYVNQLNKNFHTQLTSGRIADQISELSAFDIHGFFTIGQD